MNYQEKYFDPFECTHYGIGTRKKMKKLFLLLMFFAAASLMIACEDENEDGNERNLDPQLIGYWLFDTNDDEFHAWRFKSDGSAVQTTYGQDYNWQWDIENEKLKLYISGGVPTFQTYKIEGNNLYFWVDQISDWGLPFTKQ